MFKKARTARVERAAHHACICARWKTVESSNATLLGIAFGRVDAASLATASFFSAISALRKYRGYIRTCTPRDTKTQIGYWLYLSYTHIRTHKSVAAHTSLSLHTQVCRCTHRPAHRVRTLVKFSAVHFDLPFAT